MSVLKCPTLRQLRGYSICHPYVSVFVICTCQYLSSVYVSISHIHPIIICHIWSAFVFVDFHHWCFNFVFINDTHFQPNEAATKLTRAAGSQESEVAIGA